MIEKDPFFDKTPEIPEEQGADPGTRSQRGGTEPSRPAADRGKRRRASWWSAWTDPARMRGAVMAALYAGVIILVADHALDAVDYYVHEEIRAAAVCASGEH